MYSKKVLTRGTVRPLRRMVLRTSSVGILSGKQTGLNKVLWRCSWQHGKGVGCDAGASATRLDESEARRGVTFAEKG